MQHVEKLNLRSLDGGTIVTTKVIPGASRDRVVGVLGDALKISTSAPPEKYKANTAVAATLAGVLNVGRRDVTLLAGQTSPRKEFLIAGLAPQAVRNILADY